MNMSLYDIDSVKELLSLIKGMTVGERLALLADYDELIPSANNIYSLEEYYADRGSNSYTSVGEAYSRAIKLAEHRMYLELYIENLTAAQVSANIEHMSRAEIGGFLARLDVILDREAKRQRENRDTQKKSGDGSSVHILQDDQIKQNLEMIRRTRDLLSAKH